jgi:hypothetical protein
MENKMYCKYLSKALNGKIKCQYYKRYISYSECNKNCLNFILKRNKGINKVSKNKMSVTEETYNKVFERDKEICQLCKTKQNLHLHHIDGRGKDLTNNIDNCIMLCNYCHLEVVHKNQKKYRPILKQIIERKKDEYI